MPHRFQCRCGQLQGEVDQPEHGVRVVCYCTDCQTYGYLLGHPQRVLDRQGGTDIVATDSRYVRFTGGTEALACLSLSPRGLLRWYAKCCDTPIAATPRNWKLPYAGLVHTCLSQPDSLERSFPQAPMRVNTQSARGKPPGGAGVRGMARLAGLMLRLIASRLHGGYRASPFFNALGVPVAEVVVAPRGSVDEARRAVRQQRA